MQELLRFTRITPIYTNCICFFFVELELLPLAAVLRKTMLREHGFIRYRKMVGYRIPFEFHRWFFLQPNPNPENVCCILCDETLASLAGPLKAHVRGMRHAAKASTFWELLEILKEVCVCLPEDIINLIFGLVLPAAPLLLKNHRPYFPPNKRTTKRKARVDTASRSKKKQKYKK